ncbi:DUF3365 domain-containing protein, partial [Salmonella sp. SAL4457]|uniref:c-type heme family protein n=1 Tax=Salmonella sp. SAL4457 TaxID=3159912 RepID=UPI003979B564
YQYRLLHENQYEDSYERDLLRDFFKKDGTRTEADRTKASDGETYLYYYAVVRANRSCLVCHQTIAEQKGQILAENDPMAVVS